MKWQSILWLILIVGCSDNGNTLVEKDQSQDLVEMSDVLDMEADLLQGHCKDDDDCGGKGYCEQPMGVCFRKTPGITITCSNFESLEEGEGCQVVYAKSTGTLLNQECKQDEDCVESVYGPNCIANLCYAASKCDPASEAAQCAENEECHNVGACLTKL